MSVIGVNSILTRLYTVSERSLYVRCIEVENILWEYSLKEVHGYLPLIIESFFGFVDDPNKSHLASWNIALVTKQNQRDFKDVRNLLSPNRESALFTVINKLSADPSCRYQFPISRLPNSTRSLIEAGTVPPFYQDKVQVSPSGKLSEFLSLGAFEYYMFHFAYYLVNSQKQKNDKMPVWNKPDDCLYPVILGDYLNHFFPLDFTNAEITPVSRASPISSGNKVNHMSPKQHGFTWGHGSVLSLLHHDIHSPLATSSPVSKTATTHADLGCVDDETWRSEVLLQILAEFYLNRDECDDSMMASHTTRGNSQTGNPVRMVRLLVKHLHYFVNSAQCRRLGHQKPAVMSQWEELKRRIWPQFLQKKLYVYLSHNFEWWPLDAMFRLVLETWLSYIQPWRYCANKTQRGLECSDRYNDNDANRGLGFDGSLEEKWRPFVVDNLLFYTVICRTFLKRALRMDLSSSKNAFMLLRMSKVFAIPNLAEMLIEAESAVPDTSFNERLGHSPTSHGASSPCYSGYRYVNNVSSLLVAQIKELEGPRHEYRPLFYQLATERMVKQLLEIMERGAKNATLATQMASETKNITWMESIFGSSVDFNTTKYFYSYDEGIDNGPGAQVTETYLEQSAANLCRVFKIERPAPSLPASPNGRTSDDQQSAQCNAPEVDYVNGVPAITPKGRWQMLNGLRRFAIEYEGDPDLQPIRSFECAFLVRLLFAVSCYINTRFESEISSVYLRPGFIGRMMRQVLQPPSSSLTSQRLNCLSPSARARITSTRGTPRVSLRGFASYQSVLLLTLLYVALYVWRDISLFGFLLVVFSLLFVYFMMKTALSRPQPVVNDSGSSW